MRAVILARVSRGERTQKTDAQVQALQKIAERKAWEVVEVVEQVKSAWDPRAAAEVHEAALKPIIEGRADVLMIWALDRVIRGGPQAALAFVDLLENHHGAQLFSLQERFLSTATMDPATRELIMPVVAWAAKWESQRKSERLKAKAASKRERAERLGQRAKWGRGSMATDDDKDRIRFLEKKGLSQRAIAAEVGLSLGTVNTVLKEVKAG